MVTSNIGFAEIVIGLWESNGHYNDFWEHPVLDEINCDFDIIGPIPLFHMTITADDWSMRYFARRLGLKEEQ